MWRPLWELPGRLDLIWPLARRFTAARYRGSALGLLWAVLTPLVMIATFTFIFAGIFGARFGREGTAVDYALYLFCGLLPWTAFQESVQGSAGVVVAHANLVKRVVFPLETLPVAQVLAAVAGQLAGTAVLLLAALVVRGELHATALWLPALLLPQLVLTLGAAWLVASLGVFVRDTAQAAGLLLTAWMYLTRSSTRVAVPPVTPLVELTPSRRWWQLPPRAPRRRRARLARPRLLLLTALTLCPRYCGSPARARLRRRGVKSLSVVVVSCSCRATRR